MPPYIFAGLPMVGQTKFKRRQVDINTLHSLDAIPKIIQVVCNCFAYDRELLVSAHRGRMSVMLRTIAMHEMKRKYPMLTLKKIGESFSRDHATVIYSLGMYDQLVKYDKDFKYLVKTFKEYNSSFFD